MTIYINNNPTIPPQSTSKRTLENLIFDPEEYALREDRGQTVGLDATSAAEAKAGHKEAAAGRRPQVSVRAHLLHTLAGLKSSFSVRRAGMWATALIMLFLAVAGTVLYVAWSDGYRLETKLLLLDRDRHTNNPAGSTLENEVEILKSPQILHLLSRDLYEGGPQSLAEGGHLRTVGSVSLKELSRFDSPDQLEKWLVKRTSLSSEISPGMAKVAVQLRGDDPAFLGSVLDAYVCRYVDFRRTLEAESRKRLQQAQLDARHSSETQSTEAISNQLQKIEFQERGSKLVLQLIDSGKGVFSGFVPDQSLTGVPSLTHFQDKIVQLEIKKRALATQYMPGSREIVVIDLEIQGVRSAMRECLVEHIQFLKKEREQLLAQKGGPHHDGNPVVGQGQVYQKERCGAQLPGGNSWLVLRDGLYVLRETPVIAQRPLLARTGIFANKLIAYLAPGRAPTAVSETNGNKSMSRSPALSVDGRRYNSRGSDQGSHTQQSVPPALSTPPVWQRAATSYSNDRRQHTGQTSSRPRQ